MRVGQLCSKNPSSVLLDSDVHIYCNWLISAILVLPTNLLETAPAFPKDEIAKLQTGRMSERYRVYRSTFEIVKMEADIRTLVGDYHRRRRGWAGDSDLTKDA